MSKFLRALFRPVLGCGGVGTAGEMFPLRIRAAAMGVATATQWLANWLVTVSFPALSDWNLSGTYMMYAAFALLSFLLVWKFVEETRGKTLEEMQG